MDSTTAVLLAIIALTVTELAAVVAVMLFGHGEQTALIATLVGIVGPVVASLMALFNSSAARREVRAMLPDPPAPATAPAPGAAEAEKPA